MAGTVIANLKIMLSASWSKLKSDFGHAKKEVQTFKRQFRAGMSAALGSITAVGGAAGGAIAQLVAFGSSLAALGPIGLGVAAVLGTLFGGALFAGWGVTLAAQAEQAEVAMTTMLGNAEHAKAVMSQVEQFASETPFQTDELTKSAKMLAAFQFQAGDIVPTLRMLGDVSALIGAPIDEMAELFGKAKVQGRLFLEDINQFQGRGVPIMQALADVMGVSTDEVRNLVSAGKVGFTELHAAFSSLTSEGGKFHNGMIAQSETLAGLWSTLKDQFALIAKDIGQELLPVLKEMATLAISGMRGLRDGIRSVKEMLGYKTADLTMELPREDFSQAKSEITEMQEEVKKGTQEIKKNVLDVGQIAREVQGMQFSSSTGAFDRYTTAGFSAVEQAKRNALDNEQKVVAMGKMILEKMDQQLLAMQQNKVQVTRRRS